MCRLAIINQPEPCPMAAVVVRLTPHGIDRLQRCGAANCGKIDGNPARCERLGKACDGVRAWAAYLNGERWQCLHWLS